MEMVRLPAELASQQHPAVEKSGADIDYNDAVVVIHIQPRRGNKLIARLLDSPGEKAEGIPGTIAGDDTIFNYACQRLFRRDPCTKPFWNF